MLLHAHAKTQVYRVYFVFWLYSTPKSKVCVKPTIAWKKNVQS